MRLKLGLFNIKNIVPSDHTLIQDQTLFVNLKELREIIADDPRFSKVEIEIVHPRDSSHRKARSRSATEQK